MANVKPYIPTPQSDQGTPRIDGQQADIFPSSPMALVAIYVEIIRARFRDDNRLGLPYYWEEDPTPNPNDTGGEDDSATGGQNNATKLYIESAFTDNADARDFRPSIFVDKGTTVSSKIAVGNRAAIDLPSRTELFIDHEVTAMKIDVICKTRGQSATLADHVFRFLKGCREQIRPTFGIHDITPPVLNETTVYRRTPSDTESWSTPITFDITCKALWKTRPIAPLLQQIRFSLQTSGMVGTATELVGLELYSHRRTP
jgi:hypothetical protein